MYSNGKSKSAQVATIPAWTLPDADQRGALALFEVLALAGLESQWVRLSAADQRAIMGAVVFGKQAIMVNAEGTLSVARSVCFGLDTNVSIYCAEHVRQALAQGKKIAPGVFGPEWL